MTAHESNPLDPITRVTVTRDSQGWEVLEERGDGVIRRVRYTDWHRVERAAGLHTPEGDVVSSAPRVRYSTKR